MRAAALQLPDPPLSMQPPSPSAALARPARRMRPAVLALCATTLVGACAAAHVPIELVDRPYPDPVLTRDGTQIGLASWYGPGFHGKATAGGERYDQDAMTAAHRSLPLGTLIEVRHRETGRSVRVRINDRGPYHTSRVLDLSRAAARALGSLDVGVAPVEIAVVWPHYAGWPSVRYTVQLAAFGDRRRAEEIARRVRRYGARITLAHSPQSIGDGGRKRVYRVRVGSYADRSSAARVAAALRGHGYDPCVVELTPTPVDTTPAATSDTNPT